MLEAKLFSRLPVGFGIGIVVVINHVLPVFLLVLVIWIRELTEPMATVYYPQLNNNACHYLFDE